MRSPWYEIPFDSAIIGVMKKEYEAATKKKPTIQGCPYGSDARLLTNYGGTPTVLFGPGSIEQAHAINEFVSVEEYLQAIEILALTIAEWCNS